MTISHSEDKKNDDLLNWERMWRNVICINPKHDTIIIYTNDQTKHCPLCQKVMVTIVKPLIEIIPEK